MIKYYNITARIINKLIILDRLCLNVDDDLISKILIFNELIERIRWLDSILSKYSAISIRLMSNLV